MHNASIDTETTWTEDGRTYRELARQEYDGNNCVFSAGSVEGAGVDTLYLRWTKDGHETGGMLLLRPDEVATINWLCSGLLWSHHLGEVIQAEGEDAAGGPIAFNDVADGD